MSMPESPSASLQDGSIDTRADDSLESVVYDLAERVERLEAENDELREELAAKDERIDALENQPTVELRAGDDEVNEIADIWIAGLPIGNAAENNKNRAKEIRDDLVALDKRVESIESDSVSAADVIDVAPAEVFLPIQNLYNTVKAGGEDSLKANEARAAKVWPHFRDYADPSGGQLTLTSPKVRDILKEEVKMANPDSMTVKRVMEFLARYSGRGDDQIITMNTDSHPNQLECDREDWLEATNKMMEVAKANGAGEPVSDGGRDGGEK